MKNVNLTDYVPKPKSMSVYLRNFGPHFNKALCDFAVSNMYLDEDGDDPIVPYSKEEVDNLLTSNNIRLEHNKLYDYIFVANMAKADFMGPKGCLQTDEQVARYIKNVIDDPDAAEGVTFTRFLATMACNGVPIDWYDILMKS